MRVVRVASRPCSTYRSGVCCGWCFQPSLSLHSFAGERTIACTLFVAECIVHVEKSQSFAQWPPLLDCEDSYHGVPP